MMRRPILWLGAGALVVLLIVGVMRLMAQHATRTSVGVTSTASAPVSAPTQTLPSAVASAAVSGSSVFTVADTDRLQTALSSSDAAVAGAALAPQVRSALGSAAASLVTGGLVIDRASFRPATATVATVQARENIGGTRVLLLLERDSGQWLVYGTRMS